MILLKIQPQFLMSMPGATEMIIILVIVIILFGAKKIPDLAKGIGKGMKEFKDAKEGKDENGEIETKK
jgi:sec-independent protein translocase protein TatA